MFNFIANLDLFAFVASQICVLTGIEMAISWHQYTFLYVSTIVLIISIVVLQILKKIKDDSYYDDYE